MDETCGDDEHVDEELSDHFSEVDDDRATAKRQYAESQHADELCDGGQSRVQLRVGMTAVQRSHHDHRVLAEHRMMPDDRRQRVAHQRASDLSPQHRHTNLINNTPE